VIVIGRSTSLGLEETDDLFGLLVMMGRYGIQMTRIAVIVKQYVYTPQEVSQPNESDG
jgi:hypothetical protein